MFHDRVTTKANSLPVPSSNPASQSPLVATIRENLRQVKYPPYSRDIVSFGAVKQITVDDHAVRVELEVNSAKLETSIQIQTDAERALRALPQLRPREVRVEMTSGDGQADRLPNGFFDSDPFLEATLRPDIAQGAGYEDDGPSPLAGPRGDPSATKWQGEIPVFQWEIDPGASKPQDYGEAEAERGGWIFRMWWQIHPSALVYAAISAMDEAEEERPSVRPHPVGRNVVVNLVYDLQRKGVVAIYGTALDFRPFVEAFLEGFGVSKRCRSRGNEAPNQTAVLPDESPGLLTSAATKERNSP